MSQSIESKYYVFCPAYTRTGGPEALHQLAFYMRKVGLESYVVYYGDGFPEAKTIDQYLQYDPHVVRYGDIEDRKDNYVIAPENAPWCLNQFRHAHRCIWWLSLHANEVKSGSLKERLVYLKRKMLHQRVDSYRHIVFNPDKCWHLCASKHTYLYVRDHYRNSRVDYLVEPISLDFLKMGNGDLPASREDMVLYNPAKPSQIMTELLQRARFRYVPLKGYTPEGLAGMYKRAKLYVDFGHFGGPERMPKEAVFFGCNILVANHNAASNDFDVAIPVQYKVDDSEGAGDIEGRILSMLAGYQEQLPDFTSFRDKVEHLEENFILQLKRLFKPDSAD